MPYTFDPVFAVDPNNPANIAKNATITIFDPADTNQSPIAITDPTGSPLPNPITVDAAGMGPAYQHPTLARVGWKGAGFTGYFTSYEGMFNETVAAKNAAQAAVGAAADAGVNAAASASASLAAAVSEAVTARSAAEAAAGLVGAPADAAIAAAVSGTGATKTALNAAFATPALNTVVIIGPSLEEQNAQGSTTLDPTGGGAMRARGWFHWGNGFTGNQLHLIRNSGVGGDRFDGMLARFDTDVLAYKPKIVVIGSPTNSITAGHTLDTIIGQLGQMLDKVRSIGAKAVVMNTPPRNSFTTSARRVVVAEYNRYVASLPTFYQDVAAVDIWTPIADPATGFPATGTTLDGTHYSTAGAAKLGKAFADAVKPLLSLYRPPANSSAVDPRRIIDNPAFLLDGQGWAPTTEATVTYTKASDGYGNRANVKISGNTSAGNGLTAARGIIYTEDLTRGLFAAGNVVGGSVRVKWKNLVTLSGSTPCVPSFRVEQQQADGTPISSAHALYSSSSEWATWPLNNTEPIPMPTEGEMVLPTWQLTLAPNVGRIRVVLGWVGAASVDLEFDRLAPLKSTANTVASPSVPMVFPQPLVRADPGVTGYTYRWVANEITAADGTAVSSWLDAESGIALTQATAASQPTVETVNGKRVVRFDGVADFLAASGLTGWNSAVLVYRMVADAATGVNHGVMSGGTSGDVGITRATNDAAGVFWTGARQTTALGPATNGVWQVITLRNTDLDARAERNGTVASDTTTSAAGVSTVTSFEIGRRNTAYGRIEVSEIILRTTPLTDADMTAARTAAQTNHSALFAG